MVSSRLGSRLGVVKQAKLESPPRFRHASSTSPPRRRPVKLTGHTAGGMQPKMIMGIINSHLNPAQERVKMTKADVKDKPKRYTIFTA